MPNPRRPASLFWSITGCWTIALAALVIVGCDRSVAQPPPPWSFAANRAALANSLTSAGAEELERAGDFPLYLIDARLDEATHTIAGSERVVFTNRGKEPLETVGFHLFANGTPYHGAGMDVASLTVDDQPVDPPTAVEDRTGLLVRLPHALAPGAQVRIDLTFTTRVSLEHGFHGLLQRTDGIWCLYGWYPDLAVAEGATWQLHPISDKADPTQSEAAHVIVRLTLDAHDQVASSGSVIDQHALADGAKTVTIASAFTRNLALIVGQGFATAERQVGGTTVRSWWRPDDQGAGQRSLVTAAGALDFFSRRFGPYPYRELEVIEAPLGENVGGMEATGTVLIDNRPYEALRYLGDQAGIEVLPVFMLTLAVSHEVGHQWWYNIVGSDSYRSPWLDESLTNWSGNYYIEQALGISAGAGAWATCLMEANSEPADRRQALDAAVDAFSWDQYGKVVYGRGALMYQALRRRMGEAAFLDFLRDYLASHRFAYVDPAEWQRCLRRHAGDALVDEMLDIWVRGHGLTAQALMRAAQPVAPHRRDGGH